MWCSMASGANIFSSRCTDKPVHTYTQRRAHTLTWRDSMRHPTSTDKQTLERKTRRGSHPNKIPCIDTKTHVHTRTHTHTHTQRGDVLHAGPRQVERPLMSATQCLCSILSGPSPSDSLCLPLCLSPYFLV